MLMRSFKTESITIPVPKSKINQYRAKLKAEFGDRITIIVKLSEITVESTDTKESSSLRVSMNH